MPGFGLRIRDGGKRTWIVQYRFGEKQRRVTLGAPNTLPAEQARAEAARVLSTVTLGSDPQTEKRTARDDAAVTFGAVTPLYLAAVEARQTARYHADVKRYLEAHWSSLVDLPIKKITRSSVAKGLADIAKARGAHSADRARANLSGFFSWAIGAGIAVENPVVGTNRPVKIEARDRVLEDAELALVWASLGTGDFSAIVRLLTLTACRREEVAGMAHSERSGDLWTIPGARSKNGRPHELPLSPFALTILDNVPPRVGRDLVFGDGDGAFSGWSKSKARLDAKMLQTLRKTDPKAALKPWRLHDLRRTAATRMGDLGVQPHVVEALLNHVSGHRAGVAGIYSLRAIVRADLMKEIEDKRQASRRPVPPPVRPAPVPPRPAAAAVKPRETGSAMMQRLMEENRARDARRPVPVAPEKEAAPAQSSAEIAANAILEATRRARSCR